MDIQKEREAFEEWYQNIFKEVLFIVDENYSSLRAQFMWSSWKAAKAQAVPEGFVLVGSRDLLDLTIMINRIDLLTFGKRPAEVSSLMVSIGTRIQEVIEAQETTHD